MNIEETKIEDLHFDPANVRKHDEKNLEAIKSSLLRFGQQKPIVVDGKGIVIAGNGTLTAAKALGWEKIQIVRTTLENSEATAYAIADNRTAELASWDTEALMSQLSAIDLNGDFDGFAESMDFSLGELEALVSEASEAEKAEAVESAGKLAEQFLFAPFSVLNARNGQWQERKRQWLALGIESEVGRDDNLLKMSDTMLEHSKTGGTSVFDPVLAELAYRWFSPEGGVILDPFAGGSVRGIVAVKSDRKYVGCELRPEQVEANREQARKITPDNLPVWNCADSREIDTVCKDVQADMIFSCPPYADLEVYSDDPKDLSTLDYEEFVEAYREIIKKSCSLLRENAFACFVVGDVRDKRGNYRNFLGDTIEAFRAAGLEYYNEAILVTPAGTLPMRAGRTFAASRKLGKTHQNVLVFLKGDFKKAVEKCGPCAVADVDESMEAESTEYGEKLTVESLGGEL